ncbi:hypothetical protein Droror1_Dr00015251 [Drosera rotundifolia]
MTSEIECGGGVEREKGRRRGELGARSVGIAGGELSISVRLVVSYKGLFVPPEKLNLRFPRRPLQNISNGTLGYGTDEVNPASGSEKTTRLMDVENSSTAGLSRS